MRFYAAYGRNVLEKYLFNGNNAIPPRFVSGG
jgi:hypothetical protein